MISSCLWIASINYKQESEVSEVTLKISQKESHIVSNNHYIMFFLLSKPTSPRDTELISAARESEKEADIRFFAPWMLRLMIWPFNSSFCSFRLRLSYREVTGDTSGDISDPKPSAHFKAA